MEGRCILKIPLALRSAFETTCKPDKYAFLENRSKRNKIDTHAHVHTATIERANTVFAGLLKRLWQLSMLLDAFDSNIFRVFHGFTPKRALRFESARYCKPSGGGSKESRIHRRIGLYVCCDTNNGIVL